MMPLAVRSLMLPLVAATLWAELSLAQNLLRNGYGELGDNSNFESLTFDPLDFAVGSGSFDASGGWQSIRSTDFIAYAPNSSYQAEFYARSKSFVSGNISYAFLACYDVDKNEINTAHTMFVPGTTTTLSADLKNGDAYIYVADLSQWVNPGSFWHRRGIRVWNYANSKGYVYPPETYSRNFYKGAYNIGLWNEADGLDFQNNRIKLLSPWASGFVPAGTALSQNDNGGTYLYFADFREVGPEWTRYFQAFAPSDILPGTSFIKQGWIADYTSSGNVVSFSGLQLRERYGSLSLSSSGNVGIGTSEPENALDVNGTIRAKEVIVETDWADFVFDPDYQLPTLAEVEAHIAANCSLPGIPSAAEVQRNGLSLAAAQTLMMQKIEELTLYAIEKESRVTELEEKNAELEGRLSRMEKKLISIVFEGNADAQRVDAFTSFPDEAAASAQAQTDEQKSDSLR